MNRPDQSNDKLKLVGVQILKYLLENPDAQDTFDGIVRWWLLTKTIIPVRDVKKALNRLVKRGFVIKQKGSDSQIRYKMNHEQREEIISEVRQRS